MHYKITIFGACAPYPRLIYWITLSILQGKKMMTCHENLGADDNVSIIIKNLQQFATITL